jgi:hypothetical protein
MLRFDNLAGKCSSPRFCIVAAALIFLVTAPQAVFAPQAEDVFTIKAGDNSRYHEIPVGILDGPSMGVEILLRIASHRSLDLDMAVYARNPEVEFVYPICESAGSGPVEKCRINRDELSRVFDLSGEITLWMEVLPVAGKSATRYKVEHSMLEGPVIRDTGLFGGDTRRFGELQPDEPRPGVFYASDMGTENNAFQHLYGLAIEPPAAASGAATNVIEARCLSEDDNLSIHVYNTAGNPVQSSRAPDSPSQVVSLDEREGMFYVLVELANARDLLRKGEIPYEITVKRVAALDPRALMSHAKWVEPGRDPIFIHENDASFALTLSNRQLGFVRLENDNYDLNVFDLDGFREVEIVSRGENVKSAVLGDSFEGSRVLMEAARHQKEYLIHAQRKDTPVQKYEEPAVLTMRAIEHPSYAVSFSVHEVPAIDLARDMIRGRLVRTGEIGPEGVFVYRLTGVEGDTRFEASFGSDDRQRELYDLAICGDHGEAFALGDVINWNSREEWGKMQRLAEYDRERMQRQSQDVRRGPTFYLVVMKSPYAERTGDTPMQEFDGFKIHISDAGGRMRR